MTVIGESDKEIKSMAFTPCSFLLLFRKYFFITTSVNGKLIDQSIGKSYTLHTGFQCCKGFENNRLDFTVVFPFLAKDTNYNVTINTVYFDGLGYIDVSKCHITNKFANCVSIKITDINNSYETIRLLVDASITIIF